LVSSPKFVYATAGRGSAVCYSNRASLSFRTACHARAAWLYIFAGRCESVNPPKDLCITVLTTLRTDSQRMEPYNTCPDFSGPRSPFPCANPALFNSLELIESSGKAVPFPTNQDGSYRPYCERRLLRWLMIDDAILGCVWRLAGREA